MCGLWRRCRRGQRDQFRRLHVRHDPATRERSERVQRGWYPEIIPIFLFRGRRGRLDCEDIRRRQPRRAHNPATVLLRQRHAERQLPRGRYCVRHPVAFVRRGVQRRDGRGTGHRRRRHLHRHAHAVLSRPGIRPVRDGRGGQAGPPPPDRYERRHARDESHRPRGLRG